MTVISGRWLRQMPKAALRLFNDAANPACVRKEPGTFFNVISGM